MSNRQLPTANRTTRAVISANVDQDQGVGAAEVRITQDGFLWQAGKELASQGVARVLGF